MKMKKALALGLSAIMTIGLLAGCGGKEQEVSKTEDGKTVLRFAAFEGGNGTEVWKKIVEAFEKEHDDVKVELELSSELDKDLTKDFQNGDIPDVVYYNLGQPSAFTETMLKEDQCSGRSQCW